MPETSIVIRTLNEEKHIGNLLSAIASQTYKDCEVIIVDNESTDDTLSIAKQFGVKVVKINRQDFTWGYALNVGCKASRGKYLVFLSAHTLPTYEKWLSSLISSFENEKVAMVYGRQIGVPSSKFSERIDLQRLFGTQTKNSNVPLNYANNANAAVRKNLWEKRPFDEYLFGLEDIEWAHNMAKEGYLINYEPKASIYHIHEETWQQVFNRYRREAIAAVRIGLKHPPQARLDIFSLLKYFLYDLIKSFPIYSRNRLKEIIRFRYYQWKASKVGWAQGKHIDLEVERSKIFYPQENLSVVIRGKRRAKLEETVLPDVRPGDILLKVNYVGVCRTDLEVYDGTLGYYRNGIAEYPIVPGHEFSGTILKIGSNNRHQERFKIGQRVVGESMISKGKYSPRMEVGVINFNGAYSQYIMMPGDRIRKIPDKVDSKKAALSEPLAVVLRALQRLENRLSKDAKIAVIGAGQIGNLCTQVLCFRGYDVHLYDKNIERLKILENKTSGSDTKLNNLEKFDVIIEATGSKSVLEKVMKDSRTDSTILLLGFPYGEFDYNFEDIVGKEKVVIGSVGADQEDYPKALELLPELDMTIFTANIMPLKDFGKAWKNLKSSKHLKILLHP